MGSTFSTIYGETPHGGTKLVICFFDENMLSRSEKQAKYCRIIEYDKNDNRILEVYGIMKNNL